MIDFKLSNGVAIPAMGFGVFQMSSAEVAEHLPQAIEAGFRHIDTANGYYNEVAVGEAVRESGIPREEFFLTTKLWPRDYGTATCMGAIDASLERLGTDYVDLLLLHQPYGPYTEAWKVMEEALAAGKVRAIGLSNFPAHKFQEVLAVAEVAPQVLQVELNPRCNQLELKKQLEPLGVVFEGWYPLGHGDAELLRLAPIAAAAEAHGVEPAQVCLRWSIQHGNVVFPKTCSPEHMRQNLAVLDFELTPAEMAAIDAIPQAPYYTVPEEAPAFIDQMAPFDQQL
ncbi:aldo/keto reductase [Adlercreutzia sp. R21]|uniref:aldo/keto reductase n=1 Tax=Adlercreutzia wanghongyangiae TaxID=3111451 RepID=UPI002DBF5B68|nr:aldo/keto reductase [Adlercreutzia sp. R21]MEC4184024.1 aldo/keto reductase [Adlercreutzia sp. R21]